jgi:5-methylcytosine-specific restriction endonuclease McrA
MARTNTRRMHTLRDEFFTEGRQQSQSDDPEVRALSHCWLCRTAIDYVAEPHTTPDSHNLDHFKPFRDYPELNEDPSNFRHAHRACNQSRGARTPSAGLGEAMPDWW